MVGFFFRDIFLRHLEGYPHVESPARLEAIIDRVKAGKVAGSVKFIEPGPASDEDIELVHDKSYVSKVLELEVKDHVVLDWGDTVATPASIEAARYAAGAGIDAVKMVLSGNIDSAFCAVRPPGHHAERNRAMGFCIFNNIAIAARHLIENEGLDRVAIVDWDVHHGNGTESIFEDEGRVFYISLHQYPHYPGTGSADDVGSGAGAGYTLNIPMPAGSGDLEYLAAFTERIVPALERFEPQFILISAGFDGHGADPLSGMLLTSTAFERMTEIIVDVAGRFALGRIVSFLEGGYDLDALAESVEYHIAALGGLNIHS